MISKAYFDEQLEVALFLVFKFILKKNK